MTRISIKRTFVVAAVAMAFAVAGPAFAGQPETPGGETPPAPDLLPEGLSPEAPPAPKKKSCWSKKKKCGGMFFSKLREYLQKKHAAKSSHHKSGSWSRCKSKKGSSSYAPPMKKEGFPFDL